ncbi:MAG: polysaccharide deacetylase [Armatimonadetes bacterium]|nr:polysaccharide deacetylase [Armatimonadota bacterium]
MWPQGIRCPVVLSFNFDCELFWQRWPGRQATVVEDSQGTYGARVGVHRVLAMLARQGVPATFFIPSQVAERYPEAVRAIHGAGHEIGLRGVGPEDLLGMSAAQQRDAFAVASGALKNITGRAPSGFRLPPAPETLRIAREAGLLYSSNLMDYDLPYRHSFDGVPSELIELPVTQAFEDAASFTHSEGLGKTVLTPRQVESLFLDEFEVLYAEGLYCMFTLDPQFIGRPSRLIMLERVIAYMKSLEGVVFNTAEQVAVQCASAIPRA